MLASGETGAKKTYVIKPKGNLDSLEGLKF